MEGIIKYNVNWDDSELISAQEFQIINPYRQLAYKNSFIGIGSDNIGYGNISFRTIQSDEFVISGSATGHKAVLKRSDYSKVINFKIDKNYIKCVGGTIASSESLSHAAIYTANKDITAVLHLHNSHIWNKYKNDIPTTAIDAEYGTPKMALSIFDIVRSEEKTDGIIVMQGHRDGIIVYSDKLETLFKIISKYLVL